MCWHRTNAAAFSLRGTEQSGEFHVSEAKQIAFPINRRMEVCARERWQDAELSIGQSLCVELPNGRHVQLASRLVAHVPIGIHRRQSSFTGETIRRAFEQVDLR
jgi:hypothetical protein